MKVQKPTPKMLNANGKLEKSQKSAGKIQKKSKKPKPSESAAIEALNTLKDVKKSKAKDQEIVEVKEDIKKIKQKKDKKNKAVEITKKPLILAPPPTPPPAAVKSKKKSKAKDSQPTATIEEPAQTAKPQQKKKKAVGKVVKGNIEKSGEEGKKPLAKKQNKNKRQRKQLGKNKKEKPKVEHIFDPVPFDEETFNTIVNLPNIKKIAKALKTQVEKEVGEKKNSIFDDYRYFLNVTCFKIPNVPKRVVKLSLQHSLVGKDDDVVLVVRDLQRGAKVDYEPTKQHWEDILREAGIEGITIMPFNQLRNEMKTFESVRKFGNTYDYFLCDGRLSGQLAGFCGKIFQKPRTTFHTVRMENLKNLKNDIEKALRRTAYRQLQKGDLISIPVGNHKYTMQQLAENVDHVISELKKSYPGGLGNLRNMYLKIDIPGTTALPLYVSTAEPPTETPYVVGPREQRMLKLKREANEILSKFSISKDAEITKLNKKQISQKRKLKEAKALLLADEAGGEAENNEDAVPAKKARKNESKVKKEKKSGKEKTKKKAIQEDAAEDDTEEIVNNNDDVEEDSGSDGEESD